MKRRHISFEEDFTAALFAVMFVVMLLLFLANVPLVNYVLGD